MEVLIEKLEVAGRLCLEEKSIGRIDWKVVLEVAEEGGREVVLEVAGGGD